MTGLFSSLELGLIKPSASASSTTLYGFFYFSGSSSVSISGWTPINFFLPLSKLNGSPFPVKSLCGLYDPSPTLKDTNATLPLNPGNYLSFPT